MSKEKINVKVQDGKKYYRVSNIANALQLTSLDYALKKSGADVVIMKDGNRTSGYKYIDDDNLNVLAKYFNGFDDHRHKFGEEIDELIQTLESYEENESTEESTQNDISEVPLSEANGLLQSFVNQQFGLVRVFIKDNELWFVGKDVAEAFGYMNSSKALADHVDDEDKLNNETLSSLGQRGGWLINESGLYSMVMSSKLPSAKQFKRWVTSEVIPSIRKYGVYATAETAEKFMNDPDFMIKTFTLLKEEREKNQKMKEENERLRMVNKGLARESSSWNQRSIVNALMRSFAFSRLNGDFKYAFNILYKELTYKKSMTLKNRIGTGNLLDRVRDDEWDDVVEVAIAICERSGIDVVNAINEVNAERVMES